MLILKSIYLFVFWGVTAAALAAIGLVLLRALFNATNANPFTWHVITVKRLTDPVILPVRRALVAMRLDPIAAPLIAILIFILVGFFVVQVAGSLLNTIAGVMLALRSGREGSPVAILGYLLYGLLGIYSMVIFARIVGAWFSVGYGNRLMRFLISSTEPLLAPLRRMIPAVGMFDISPMVAFLIVWLLQGVVAGTLLRGWESHFF